jgi:hypothetical protein
VKLFSNFCRDRNLSAFRHFGAHDKNYTLLWIFARIYQISK